MFYCESSSFQFIVIPLLKWCARYVVSTNCTVFCRLPLGGALSLLTAGILSWLYQFQHMLARILGVYGFSQTLMLWFVSLPSLPLPLPTRCKHTCIPVIPVYLRTTRVHLDQSSFIPVNWLVYVQYTFSALTNTHTKQSDAFNSRLI